MTQRKVFLGAGHSNVAGRDGGAARGKDIEGVLAAEYRALLANELEALGVCVIMDPSQNIFSETYHYFKRLANPDALLIDIHFNSGPPGATGTETVVDDFATQKELEIGRGMSQITADTLGIPMRNGGIRYEKHTAHKKILWFDIPGINVLHELCFISNPSDMEKYHANKHILAKRHAMLIKTYV